MLAHRNWAMMTMKRMTKMVTKKMCLQRCMVMITATSRWEMDDLIGKNNMIIWDVGTQEIGVIDTGNSSATVPRFKCDPPCPAAFDKMAKLVSHKDSIRCYLNLPFVCDICKKRFRKQESKDQHYRKGRCNKENLPPGIWLLWLDYCAIVSPVPFLINTVHIVNFILMLRQDLFQPKLLEFTDIMSGPPPWYGLPVPGIHPPTVRNQQPTTVPAYNPPWFGSRAPGSLQPRSELLVSSEARAKRIQLADIVKYI